MGPFGGSPFSGDPFALNPAAEAGAGLGNTLEDQDNSLIGNLSRFLSRPMYGVTSLLAGDPIDAAENLIQLGLDLPTLGFVNRNWSLGNLFSETGDITDRSERREASDLLGYEGDGIGKLLLDVGGGMLLDPLTYLTFGGSGIAKGGLTGMAKGAAASKVAMGLKSTQVGASMLDDAIRAVVRGSGDDFARAVSRAGGVDELVGAADDVLEELYPDLLNTGARRAKAMEAAKRIEVDAVERIIRGVNPAAELGVQDPQLWRAAGDTLDEVVEDLIGQGALYADDALRLDMPFGFNPLGLNTQKPLVRNVWGKIGQASPIGLSQKLGDLAMQDGGKLVEAVQRESWNWVKRTFYDKIGTDPFGYAGKIPEGLKHLIRKIDYESVGDIKRRSDKVKQIFPVAKFSDDVMRQVGDLYAQTEDAAAELLGELRERTANEVRDQALAAGKTSDVAMAAVDEAMKNLRALPSDEEAYLLERLKFQLRDELGDGLGREAFDSLRLYMDEMEKIPQELVKAGVWGEAYGKALYMPHRINARLADLLADPGVIRELKTAGTNLDDVFTKARKNATRGGYEKAVLERLAQVGDGKIAHIMEELDLIERTATDEAGKWFWKATDRLPSDVDGVMETNLRDLFLRRELAHSQTLKRNRIWTAGDAFGMTTEARPGSMGGDLAIRSYIDGILDNGRRPQSKLVKFFSGGTIDLPLPPSFEEAPELLKMLGDARIVGAGSSRKLRLTTRGINYPIKTMLTSFPTNPAFHVRNWLGAMAMATFDPDLGLDTFVETLKSFPLLPWLGEAGQNMSSSNTRKLVRVLQGLEPEELLDQLPGSVGKYTWREAAEHVRNAVGDVTELQGHFRDMGDAARMTELGAEGASAKELAGVVFSRGKGAKISDRFQAAQRLGELASDFTEKGARTAAMLELLRKGVDPIEAAKRVGDTFVDYRSQSTIESAARAFVPFLKFQTASMGWAGKMAARPRTLTPFMRLRGSAESSLNEGEVLPGFVQDGLGIRAGTDDEGNPIYMQSLGLPHEATFQGMAIPSSFAGLRKGLGMIHPLPKFFLEGSTDRDFFTGDEFGSYHKAPILARPFASVREGKDGRKHYEIPGFWREVFEVLPVSRIDSTVGRFLDESRPLWDAALQNLSGVRFRTVDEERELKTAMVNYLKDKSREGQLSEFTTWVSKGDPENMPEDLKVVLDKMARMRRKAREERK